MNVSWGGLENGVSSDIGVGEAGRGVAGDRTDKIRR
jgi:hypothetical protein